MPESKGKLEEKTNQECRFFARAMSSEEYLMWEEEGEVYQGTEWVDMEGGSYGMAYLKEDWVDAQLNRRFGDVYALIIGVRARAKEFIETPMVAPKRYTNVCPIPMSCIKIIYDPRKVVTEEGVDLDLNDPMRLLR